MARSIYTLATTTNATGKVVSQLKPVPIKMGVSDGVQTEVLDGLKEGDEVVVGVILPETGTTQRPPPNPFGGGRRF